MNHVIKLSKKMYYEEQLLIKYKQDIKMTWRTLNEILNKRMKNKELPKEFMNE